MHSAEPGGLQKMTYEEIYEEFLSFTGINPDLIAEARPCDAEDNYSNTFTIIFIKLKNGAEMYYAPALEFIGGMTS